MNRLYRQMRFAVTSLLFVVTVLLLAGCHPPLERCTAGSEWRVDFVLPNSERARIAVSVLDPASSTYASHGLSHLSRYADREPNSERYLMIATLGIESLMQGDVDRARESLDKALKIMGARLCDEQTLEKILSPEGSEFLKAFRGEPYERALCLFYRGLVYAADRDYENARAAFRQSQLQIFRVSNAGKAEYCAFHSAQTLEQLMDKWLEKEAAFETLVVIALGHAPVKIQLGEALRYREFPTRIAGLKIRQENGGEDRYLQGDLVSRLACFITQREIERLFHAKRERAEEFKERSQRAEKVGKGAINVANMLNSNPYSAPVGLGILLLTGGYAAHQGSEAEKYDTRLDLRQIPNMPATVFVAEVPMADQTVELVGMGNDGDVILEERIRLPKNNGEGPAVVIVRWFE